MAVISIQHIGPLIDTGSISLSRFNIVIGKQSTGKSTFLKILSYCQWLEKQIMITEDKRVLANYTHYNRFIKELKQFHRLSDSFFSEKSRIFYEGEGVYIYYQGDKKNAQILKKTDFDKIRHNTKLSFIPSERNLISAIKNIDRAYRTNENDSFINHLFEWSNAKEHSSEKQPVDLSVVANMEYYYDGANDMDYIKLKDLNKKISPYHASSGVQSVLPIMVMTKYFTSDKLFDNVDFNKFEISKFLRILAANNSKDDSIKEVSEKYSAMHKYRNTRLFIEEPEQNLFPESQQALIQFLVNRINRATAYTNTESSLTLTTHSPYIITAFNVMLLAAQALKIDKDRTSEIISPELAIPLEQVSAFFITEDGEFQDIVDKELYMISGLELDHASTIVDEQLSILNDIIYG